MERLRGNDPQTAGFIVAIFAAMGIFSKPLDGWACDKFNGARRVPAMITLGLFSIMLVIFGMISTEIGFLLAAPLPERPMPSGSSGVCWSRWP